MIPEEHKAYVFKHRPHLAKVYRTHGEESLLSYAAKVFTMPGERARPEVAEVIEDLSVHIFGEDIRGAIKNYFSHTNYVSTVDHHGPLNLPSFVQGNIVQAYANAAHGIRAMIILSTASVSLDNHAYPRGLMFHDEAGGEVRQPLLSRKYRQESVYATRPYERIAAAKLGAPYTDERSLALPTYHEQMTYTNFHLFRKLPGFEDFSCITLPIEAVVRELIVSHGAAADILFDPIVRDAYLAGTDGIKGAYTSKGKKGTVFFWRINNNKRQQLHIQGNCLVTEAGGYILSLEPDHVHAALRSGAIMPGMALCLVVVSFWGGLTSGGGYSQVDYLSEIKDRTHDIFKNVPITDHLGSDYLFAFDPNGVPLTFMDIVRRGEPVRGWIGNHIQRVTLAKAIDNVLPEVYKVVSGQTINDTPHFHEKSILT